MNNERTVSEQVLTPIVKLCLFTTGVSCAMAIGMRIMHSFGLTDEPLRAQGMLVVGGLYLFLALPGLAASWRLAAGMNRPTAAEQGRVTE